jgi:hypothetical protein
MDDRATDIDLMAFQKYTPVSKSVIRGFMFLRTFHDLLAPVSTYAATRCWVSVRGDSPLVASGKVRWAGAAASGERLLCPGQSAGAPFIGGLKVVE